MRHALYLALPLVFLACPMADPGGGGGGGVDAGNAPTGDAGNTPRPDAGTPGQANTIQEIRAGAVEVEAQVLIENAVVTAIQPGRGLWIQQGSGPDSGIYLFGSEAADTAGLVVGKAVDLQGVYTVFNDLKQIKFPTLTAMRDGQLPEPFVVSAADLATSPSWEGVLVRAESLTIVTANPDGPDNDYGQIEVNDGLLLDDDLFSDLRHGRYFLRQVGTEFTSVTGIAHLSFGNRKLLPRQAEDLVVVGGAPDFTVTVQQIQQGEVAENSPVTLEGVVVTATTHASEERYRGLWVQQGRGPHSGIYVFFGANPLPAVVPGSRVNLTGTYSEFHGQSQVVRAEVEVLGEDSVPEPSTVMAAELAGASDGANHVAAEMWEGVLVAIENVALEVVNPDSANGELCAEGDDDCNDFGTIEVSGGLRVTDRLWPTMSDGNTYNRQEGQAFTRIVGIAEEVFGHHSLAPRGVADMTLP